MAESPFVDGPGPGWDPEAAAAGAEEVRTDERAAALEAGEHAAFELPEVEETKIRQALFVVGDGLHALAGVGEYDWLMTQRDLDRIAPPLTNILNRYDAARIAAGYSDELAVGIGFGLWGWRSLLERVAVLRAQEHGEVTGTPAPEPARQPPAPPVQARPAWPADVPEAPQAAPAPPPPAPAPPRAGGDPFPGAGAPQEATATEVEVAPGYVTRAERFRKARERTPNAVAGQGQGQAE